MIVKTTVQNEGIRQKTIFPIFILDIPHFCMYPKVSFNTKTNVYEV